jgi:lipoate-protein ligase A
MNTWLVVNSGRCGSAENMAMDEALLTSMPRLGRPILRFYGWLEPAATFGYFQRYAEVERLTPLRPLVRRPTGGGIVPHDADWTYSLAFPAGHPWHELKAVESYRRAHAWIQSAFEQMGVRTELAPAALKAQAGQCFAGWEQFDVLRHGRKIAGAAQRRTRDGLLIQGSVQPPTAALERAAWEREMLEAARLGQNVDWLPCEPDSLLRARAEELAARKYSQSSFNRRR